MPSIFDYLRPVPTAGGGGILSRYLYNKNMEEQNQRLANTVRGMGVAGSPQESMGLVADYMQGGGDHERLSPFLPKPDEPYTLAPGQGRYRGSEQVAYLPPTEEPYTLGEGQIRFGPGNSPIARGPEKMPEYVSVSPGGSLIDKRTGRPVYTSPAAPSLVPVPPGGSLVDKATGKSVFTAPADPTKVDPFTKAEMDEGAKQAVALPDLAANAADSINRATQVNELLKTTATGPFVGSDEPILGIFPSPAKMRKTLPGGENLARLEQSLAGLRLDAAELLKGQGSVTEFERQELANFTGKVNLPKEALEQAANTVIKAKRRTQDMANDWASARATGENNFARWKSQWMKDRLAQEGGGSSSKTVKNDAPIQGARKAPDGNYYVPDPNRPGKYLRVD